MNVKRMIPILMGVAMFAPVSVAGQTADEQIQSALDQATEAGIPVTLLESKIQEGHAKGVALDRIADAVQARLDGLARAQEALAGIPEVASSDLEVGADALESGVSEAVLAELAMTTPGGSRTAAIAALTYLVDEGIVPEEALLQVESALARGPDALQNLPEQARVPDEIGPPAGVPAGPPTEIPVPGNIPSEIGPPAGVPAPGETPAGGLPGGAEPPSGLPGSGGPPSGPPVPGDLPGV